MSFKTLALVLAMALALKKCITDEHGAVGLVKGGLWERSGPLGDVTADEVVADMWLPGSKARVVPGRMLGNSANLNGKFAIVTGANTGLGKETSRVLASRGCHVVMACRDEDRCRAAASDVMMMTAEEIERGGSVEVMQLDLASLASVRAFAEVLLSKMDEGWGYSWQRIDFLINNAGIVRKEKLPSSALHRLCQPARMRTSHASAVLGADGATKLRRVYRWLRKTVCYESSRALFFDVAPAAAARRGQPHYQPLLSRAQARASRYRSTPASSYRCDVRHPKCRWCGPCGSSNWQRFACLRDLKGCEYSVLARATQTSGGSDPIPFMANDKFQTDVALCWWYLPTPQVRASRWLLGTQVLCTLSWVGTTRLTRWSTQCFARCAHHRPAYHPIHEDSAGTG